MSKTVNLYLSCHCRTFTSTISLPTSSLPLKSAICHCAICRRTTGQLFATFAVIPLPTKPKTSGLTGFESTKSITRWFCSCCSCSVWNDDRGNDEWEITTGLISGVTYSNDVAESSISYDGEHLSRGPGSPGGSAETTMSLIDGLLDRVQLWVHSTGDGGGAVWIDGGILQDRFTSRRKSGDRNSKPVDDDELRDMVCQARAKVKLSSTRTKATQTLGLKCQCGNVDIRITRLLSDTDPTPKFRAGVDACFSDRKASGFEITSWATIPAACFTWTATHTPVRLLEEDEDSPVFGRYVTSLGVMRYFCLGCGALVFWVREGRETWDVGVGLLRGEECDQGARVEGWLVWEKYVDGVQYVEDAVDREFVAALSEGVQRDRGGEWRME